MVAGKRGRPRKLRSLDKLTKQEKEEIYYKYENGGREKSLSEFAAECYVSPIDMSKLLRTYAVSTGEDVNNELKSILQQDSDIIKKGQDFINNYFDDLMTLAKNNRKKVGIKELEVILKALDNSLKRSTIITKTIEDRQQKKESKPLEIKLSL